MKRVRIMLAAIAVLGTVGGALAFKAKSPTPPLICYKTTQDPVGKACAALTPDYTLTNVGVANIRYTTTVAGGRVDCVNITNCLTLTRATVE